MQKAQLLAGQGRTDEALALMQAGQAAFAKAGSELGQGLALEGQAGVYLRRGDLVMARRVYEEASQVFGRAGIPDGEARLCVRLGDMDAAEGKPDGGLGFYKRALRLSRQNKPGDYSLGALLGMAINLQKLGRKLESLQLALLCERVLKLGLMPPSEPGFNADLVKRAEAVLGQIGAKLMQSVVDEARARLAKEDARAQLKEGIEKNWS